MTVHCWSVENLKIIENDGEVSYLFGKVHQTTKSTRSKRTNKANLPMFSIVFYSKTIRKQKTMSEWVEGLKLGTKYFHMV